MAVISDSNSIYETLKQEITHFIVKPGERLLEVALSDRFGISRTPVREALQRLEHEGLVVGVPGGRAARTFDLREFEDMYRLRASIEELAVTQACERADDDSIERLKARVLEGYDSVRDASRGDDCLAVEERAHMGIAELCENEMLISTLARINDRISVLRKTDFSDPTRVAVTRAQHEEILDAIASRDAERACSLMRAHIAEAQANISRLVIDALSRAYLRSEAR